MAISFENSGIDQLIAGIRQLPAQSRRIGSAAINKAITSGRADASRRIYTEIAFPSNYLGSPNNGNARLRISKRASQDDLKAVISARVQPTSLARFATFDARGQNVRVRVEAGKPGTFMPRAFTVRLRSGAAISQGNFNLGLAFRTPRGASLTGSRAARQIAPDLYLLYGPSVDQAFQLVGKDIEPGTALTLRNEYLRLLNLLEIF